jgi:hypothetical protein
MPALIAKG